MAALRTWVVSPHHVGMVHVGDAGSIQSTLMTIAQINAASITKDPDGSYSSSVTSRQAGGNLGATQLGPDIDATFGIGTTGPYTQNAWQLNEQLSIVNSAGSSLADAQRAQDLLTQMIDAYDNGLSAAGSTIPSGGKGSGASTPSSIPWGYVGLGVGALVLGVGVVAVRARMLQPERVAAARGWVGEDSKWMRESGW
jgi:hypothetical protein